MATQIKKRTITRKVSDADLRPIARSAGTVHGQKVKQWLSDAEGTELYSTQVMLKSLQRLQRRNLVSSAEASELKQIINAFSGNASAQEMLSLARAVYRNLNTQNSSPTALAIASVAVNTIQTWAGGTVLRAADNKDNKNVAKADVEGALAGAEAGAVIGGELGGGIGAVIGGVVGAAAGATASSVAESKGGSK